MDTGENIEFPVVCHFKVITVADDMMQHKLQKVLDELGVKEIIEQANASSSGKFLSFGFSSKVESLEDMKAIDEGLKAVEGVKMIM